MSDNQFRISKKTVVGMLWGIVLPMGVLISVWLYQLPTISLWRYWELMIQWGAMKHQMMLAVISNMLLFYGFYHWDKTERARGVVISTLLFAIITVVLFY